MLQSDRYGDEVRGDGFSFHAHSATYPEDCNSSLGTDNSELESLLSACLSPNKRAVIATLLAAWNTTPQVHLKQTG
ncbi:hypothetical protein ACQ4M4_21620 [Leptolyngbya sp. AN02str]|uniref:hypothetical protein n=1 Tax=Leptolyngbya sp. AN02str TaxID=3423363 RepID=UPI003D31E264